MSVESASKYHHVGNFLLGGAGHTMPYATGKSYIKHHQLHSINQEILRVNNTQYKQQ